jgi:hypothetical protein
MSQWVTDLVSPRVTEWATSNFRCRQGVTCSRQAISYRRQGSPHFKNTQVWKKVWSLFPMCSQSKKTALMRGIKNVLGSCPSRDMKLYPAEFKHNEFLLNTSTTIPDIIHRHVFYLKKTTFRRLHSTQIFRWDILRRAQLSVPRRFTGPNCVYSTWRRRHSPVSAIRCFK